jgi:hypothetical protein
MRGNTIPNGDRDRLHITFQKPKNSRINPSPVKVPETPEVNDENQRNREIQSQRECKQIRVIEPSPDNPAVVEVPLQLAREDPCTVNSRPSIQKHEAVLDWAH